MATALIIDDDFVMQTALQDYLEEAGFDVIEAYDGEAGLAHFRESKPDIILLDVEMPGLNGYDACRQIRANPGGQHVPIVMMTGHEDADSVDRAYEAGATDFVSKPMNFAILVHRVRHLLKTTETSAELRRSQASLAQAQRIAKLGSWEFDIKTLHFHCTEEAARLINPRHPMTDFPLLSMLRLIHDDDRPRYEQQFLEAIEQGKDCVIDFRLRPSLDIGPSVDVHIHQEVTIELNDAGTAVAAVGTFQDTSEIHATQRKIKELAYFDSVTGLPNRSSFMEELRNRLDMSVRNRQMMALMFVDIDQFKRINDTWGHQVGDELLIQVARRLSKSLRADDIVEPASSANAPTLARLGGDEFVVLLSGVNRRQDVSVVAARLIDELKQPFYIENLEMHVSASIGVSCYPNDGNDEQTLLRHADIAMYQVKEQGRNAYLFYEPGMNDSTAERLNLENSLRRAIEQDEFELYYQAKISSRTREVEGVEALIRWRHPELGVLQPNDFIHIAEECGLIVPIGEWVLDRACKQLNEWQSVFGANFTMSVNASSMQYRQAQFVTLIKETLNRHNVAPSALQIELTESMLIDDMERSHELLEMIRAIGVEIAIDDFGTGYSSMKYLKNLPISNLKIDRSFVAEMAHDTRDAGIVEAVIALSHHLQLHVIAEGVENDVQLHMLEKAGCDAFQGHYFCPPLNATEFVAWYRDYNHRETRIIASI